MLEIYRPAPPIHWDWLTLRGPDAADFLHRLTTADVRAMAPGEGTPGFFLTAQGKMRAYFHLHKVSKEEFFLEYDAGATGHWKQELRNVIEEFHFGEKFTLETAPEQGPALACVWLLGPKACPDVEGVRVFDHGSLDYGTPWATAWGEPKELDSWVGALRGARSVGFEQLERMRVSMARPRIDFELSSGTIPLDAGLREAISENKGCYPGQEVIEKIISLGSPARRLARIDGKGPAPLAGQAVFAEDKAGAAAEIGKLTSVIMTEGGFQALAFVRKTHAREGVEVRFGADAASTGRIALVPEYKT